MALVYTKDSGTFEVKYEKVAIGDDGQPTLDDQGNPKIVLATTKLSPRFKGEVFNFLREDQVLLQYPHLFEKV